MMDDGHIFIDDVITPDMLSYVKQRIKESAAAKELTVHIQSPGGSVYAGYNIYHALKLSGKPINVIIEGEAQSMGTFIACAASPGCVSICNPSVYMVHNPSTGLDLGTADAFEQGASELRNIENDMVRVYVEKTGLPEDEIRTMMRKETRMTASEAVTKGFADKLLNSYSRAVALGKTNKHSMDKTKIGLIDKIITLTARALGQPVAMDYKTTDGLTINVSEDGMRATIAGEPANGTYTLEDGKTITVENGMVKTMSEPNSQQNPPAAVPPAAQPAQAAPAAAEPTAEQKLAEAQAKIAALEASAAAGQAAIAEAQAAKDAAIAASTQTATALGEIQKELITMKQQTVGDDSALPITVRQTPRAMQTKQQKETVMEFIAENLPWLLPHYGEEVTAKYIAKIASRGPQALSIVETNFNYTYPGILTTDIYYKPSLGNPALTDIFTIDQGIKDRKRYNLVNPISKILKPYTGCARTFNQNRALITNTTVQTKEFQINESWCKDDFTGQLSGTYNFLAQEWLKTGIDSFDPSGTPIEKVIDSVLYNALRIDVFRRVSFAAGNSSDDDYNQFDGLWDRLIDSSGGSNYCVVRAQANPGVATGFGTGTLAAGAALIALESAYANSNILLRDWDNIYAQFSGTISKPTFFVTRSVWDNYYNSLIGTGAVTEQAFENLQKGLTTLTYKGYPVRPVSLWDQFLAESDNPLFAITRHLILFTTKDNHILGVESSADLNKISGWYERKDRQYYFEGDMKMGYNYLHCDLQTIVY